MNTWNALRRYTMFPARYKVSSTALSRLQSFNRPIVYHCCATSFAVTVRFNERCVLPGMICQVICSAAVTIKLSNEHYQSMEIHLVKRRKPTVKPQFVTNGFDRYIITTAALFYYCVFCTNFLNAYPPMASYRQKFILRANRSREGGPWLS